MFSAGPRHPAHAYARVALDTAARYGDDHTLIQLLFDGALTHIGLARGAMERHDVAAKGQAINQATSILVEGLLAALDMEAGGELAQNLARLYLYMTDRLVAAHRTNTIEPLIEVRDLLEGLRDAWSQIRPGSQVLRAA